MTSGQRGHVDYGEKPGQRSLNTWQARLQQQMDAWHKDPHWVDQPPSVQVHVPQDAFLQLTSECLLGIPPDAVFNTLCDPGNRRVFKNVKGVVHREVLEREGNRQVVELEQLAIWRFLFLSGTFSVRLRVTEDRDKHTMSFYLSKPGFMKHFKGSWKLEAVPVPPSSAPPSAIQAITSPGPKSNPKTFWNEQDPAGPFPPRQTAPVPGSTMDARSWGLILSPPGNSKIAPAERLANHSGATAGPSVPWYGPGTRIATVARVFQEVSPAVIPPPFLAHYLRGISASTTLEVMKDFQVEAARLRFDLPEESNVKEQLRRMERAEEGERGGREERVREDKERDRRRRKRRGHFRAQRVEQK